LCCEIPVVDFKVAAIDQKHRHVETLNGLGVRVVLDQLEKHGRVFQIGDLLNNALACRVQLEQDLLEDFGQVKLQR
jgi:hypothetical protein